MFFPSSTGTVLQQYNFASTCLIYKMDQRIHSFRITITMLSFNFSVLHVMTRILSKLLSSNLWVTILLLLWSVSIKEHLTLPVTIIFLQISMGSISGSVRRCSHACTELFIGLMDGWFTIKDNTSSNFSTWFHQERWLVVFWNYTRSRANLQTMDKFQLKAIKK